MHDAPHDASHERNHDEQGPHDVAVPRGAPRGAPRDVHRDVPHDRPRDEQDHSDDHRNGAPRDELRDPVHAEPCSGSLRGVVDDGPHVDVGRGREDGSLLRAARSGADSRVDVADAASRTIDVARSGGQYDVM